MRAFNISCLVAFFISIFFAFPFFGFLKTPQIIFYLIFIVVSIVNLAFHLVGQQTKLSWIRNKFVAVVLPVLVMIGLQLASLVLFLSQLDDLNDKINNMYPVAE